jgi:hypothetical protein
VNGSSALATLPSKSSNVSTTTPTRSDAREEAFVTAFLMSCSTAPGSEGRKEDEDEERNEEI